MEPGPRAFWPVLLSALFGFPLFLAFLSCAGGTSGRWRESGSNCRLPGQRESLVAPDRAPISWWESMRTGGAAFLIANGALATIAWLWLMAMILIVASR